MKTTFTSKDQNWADGETTYWFDVEFTAHDEIHQMTLGVVESGCDKPAIVNDECYPIVGDWFECYVSSLTESVTEEMRMD